jgi:hypothetical protein
MSATGSGRVSVTASLSSTATASMPRAASVASTSARVVRRTLTRKVSGGCWLSAAAIACQRSGQSACNRSSHHAGWL